MVNTIRLTNKTEITSVDVNTKIYTDSNSDGVHPISPYNLPISTATQTILDTKASSALETRHYIGTTGEPVFQNSWVNYGSGERQLSYWKDNFGIVHIEGSIKSGTLGATVFTLPTGYRPAENIYFTIVGPSSSLAIASVNNSGPFIVNGSNNSVMAIQLAFRP